MGIEVKSGDVVGGITKIYCAKVEPVFDQSPIPQPLSREIKLPQKDTEEAQPATPGRDLRMIPRVEPVPQYTPPAEVPQRIPEEE